MTEAEAKALVTLWDMEGVKAVYDARTRDWSVVDYENGNRWNNAAEAVESLHDYQRAGLCGDYPQTPG